MTLANASYTQMNTIQYPS